MTARNLSLLTLLLPLHGICHDYVPPHSCSKPDYAIDYEDDEQLAVLESQVAAYQQCLREYLQYELDQIEPHSDATQKAVADLEAIADDVIDHAPADLLEEWKEEYRNTDR